MAFDAEDEVRGLTLLGADGDLEISWEPQNDEKVRALIEKKMREGVTFFVLKPVIGDMIHMRRKLKKTDELKGRQVTVKDADIAAMWETGDVDLIRTGGDKIDNDPQAIRVRDSKGQLDHAAASKRAVKQRTVGVPALQGG